MILPSEFFLILHNDHRLIHEEHDGCFVRGKTCFSFANSWVYHRYLAGSISLIFLGSFVVFLALFVFVLCLVYPMLPVYLDCPFWIFSVVFISPTFIQLTKYYHMSYLSICFIYSELLFTFCRPLNMILSIFLTILLNLCIA